MPSNRRTIFALFALALGVRILYSVLFAAEPIIPSDPITSDLRYAMEIASGFDWLQTAYSPRAPGYPAVLAALYWLSAKQIWLTIFFQSALSALTVLVFYYLGCHFLGTTVALLAALWFAVSPHHILYAGLFFRETLVVFLMLNLLLFVTQPFQRMGFAVLAGGTYTLLIHTDPQFILLLPVLGAILLFFKTRHAFLNLQYFFLFAATLIVFSTPWVIRNQRVYQQPVPIALEASRFLWPARVVSDPDQTRSEIESRIEGAAKTRRVQKNTLEFWRFARFSVEVGEPTAEGIATKRDLEPAWSTRHNVVSTLSYGLLLPFFVLGLFFALRMRNRTALMLAVTTIAYFLMRAYLGGSERARVPIEPLIILIAFYGVLVLKKTLFKRDSDAEV